MIAVRLLAVLAILFGLLANQTGVKLTGKTMDIGASPAVALPGVTVQLMDAKDSAVVNAKGEKVVTTSSSTGVYTFDDVKPGEYRLRFEKLRYDPGDLAKPCSVAAGAAAPVTVEDANLWKEEEDEATLRALAKGIIHRSEQAPLKTEWNYVARWLTPLQKGRAAKEVVELQSTAGTKVAEIGLFAKVDNEALKAFEAEFRKRYLGREYGNLVAFLTPEQLAERQIDSYVAADVMAFEMKRAPASGLPEKEIKAAAEAAKNGVLETRLKERLDWYSGVLR